MSLAEGSRVEAAVPASGSRPVLGLLLPVFAATLMLSATLLFSVQPLFTKMVLPLLGGSPAVWNTAMVFFQAALLGGYLYSHALAVKLTPRLQVFVHLAVLGLAALSLPIAVAQQVPDQGSPVLWLIGVMAGGLGLPFFAISATAPLMQRWFAQSGHEHARDPYFLYGASNLGSILALLSYPFLIEPILTTGIQAWVWALGYILLVAMIGLCGALLLRQTSSRAAEELASAEADTPQSATRPTWSRRLHWAVLAFVPSSLLLGVTAHITTDVAAVPLLWVIPLALFLLTHVIVFARRPILRHRWMVAAQPYALALVLVSLVLPAGKLSGVWVVLPVHLLGFFVCAMVCHGELVRHRPSAQHLTAFYLWMALGGVLGGLFNAVLAPLLFPAIYEYGIALALACLLRPGSLGGPAKSRILDFVLPLGFGALLILPSGLTGIALAETMRGVIFAVVLGGYLVVFSFKDRPLRYGLGVGAFLLAFATIVDNQVVLHRDRSFFGVYTVKSANDGDFTVLNHGTTIHGAQHTDPARFREPLTYFTPQGPLGQAIAALREAGEIETVGLLGLGIGSILCYRTPEEDWTIYEIDPLMYEIAADTRFFNYLDECWVEGATRMVYGDGRLSLEGEPPARFDLLIMDAFSSDSIPMHLITREAMLLYFSRLRSDGVLLFHISNRHLDVRPVLSALAASAGAQAVVQHHIPDSEAGDFHGASTWVALARDPASLQPFRRTGRWQELEAADEKFLWTDDFSNILGVLR